MGDAEDNAVGSKKVVKSGRVARDFFPLGDAWVTERVIGPWWGISPASPGPPAYQRIANTSPEHRRRPG